MNRLIAIASLIAVIAAPAAQAAVSDAEFDEVRKMLEMALGRIDELEQQQAADAAAQARIDTGEVAVDATIAEQVAANTARLDKSSWAERIKLKGDFRYRYQNGEVNDVVGESDEDRNRNRIRARAAIIAEVEENWEVGLGFASGGDDPVSTNQTLGGGGSTKDINLDLAYFDWTGLENTSVRGGKFKRTLKAVGKSQLQWDSDWRPEGFDVAWENDMFFAQGLGTYLESDDSKFNSEFAYLLQAGTTMELGPVDFTGGVGYTFIDAEGEECFYDFDDGSCFGNESSPAINGDGDAVTVYDNDFNVYNVFAEAGFEVGSLPVKVFGDWIKNDDADDNDSGFLVGAELGKVKKAGDWKFKAYYEELESNATLALLTNSDFGGGGTNGEGWVVAGGYGLTDKVQLAATYYMVDRNTDRRADINSGEEFEVNTFQLDLKFKYK